MPWVFAYYTGMRTGELKLLLWAWVDWSRWVVVIPVGVSKNEKIRIVPIYDEMREHLKQAFQLRDPACPYLLQHEGRQTKSWRTAFANARSRARLTKLLTKPLADQVQKLNQSQLTAFDWVPDAEVPALFERTLAETLSEQQIKDAFPGHKPTRVLFHDQRRTAVRNMERAGIQRTIARGCSGHLTESIYTRYAIGAEKDALAVGEQMTEFHRAERAKLATQAEPAAPTGNDSGFLLGEPMLPQEEQNPAEAVN